MEPLKTNRRCLTWLGILPADESTTRRQKFAYAIFSRAVVIALLFGAMAGLVHCWKHVSVDPERSMFTFCITVGEFTAIYTALVGGIFLHRKIGTIFDNLTAISKDKENSDSHRFLIRANDTSEWMWKMYFKIMAAEHVMIFAVAPVASVLFNYAIHRNFNVDNYFNTITQAYVKSQKNFVRTLLTQAFEVVFYVLIRISLPWNQSTPVGYVGETAFSCLYSFSYWTINGTFLLLFISIRIFHQAFYEMILHAAKKLNEPDNEKIRCDENFLCYLMHSHLSAKKWFLHTADVYSSINMISLICNEMVLALSIFYVDYQFQHHSFNVMSFTTAGISLSNLFIYCYLGKTGTEFYAKISDCVYYKIKWYKMPTGLQKHFILVIQNMQQPLCYHGFGVICLNLETFTRLVKSAMSYYMAVKALTSNN